MQARRNFRRDATGWFQLGCGVALIGCVLVAALASLHWPLVGDAALMHYIVFLHRHGLTPYKDIVDINLPGTYAFESLAMRCFGPGALGWRIYDLFLLLMLGAAAVVLAGKGNRFGGIFAGAFFALVHLQDGLAQGGQRNLLMAVLLLWAYVALFRGHARTGRWWMFLLAGIGLGCTATIKPVLLPLAVVLFVVSAWFASRSGRSAGAVLLPGAVGVALPLLAMLVRLERTGALADFVGVCRDLLPLHASLGRHSFPYLLSHCLSPVAVLAGLWLLLAVLQPQPFDAERIQLFLGLLGTLLAYLAEGKGYPYQRYPFLAILILVIGTDLGRALYGTATTRALAIATCGLSCFVLAPRFAWLATSFSPQAPFQEALSVELRSLGSPETLNGQVQCLDTFGGCVNSLYDLQVRQSTGFLYDCYLFSGESPVTQRYRAAFWAALERAKPRILVETNQFCFGDPRGFGKLETWPLLAASIATDYRLASAWKSPILQHWWSRKDQPAEFRVYVRTAR